MSFTGGTSKPTTGFTTTGFGNVGTTPVSGVQIPGVNLAQTPSSITQTPSSITQTPSSSIQTPSTQPTTQTTITNQPHSNLTLGEVNQSLQKVGEELVPTDPRTLFKAIFYNYADDPADVQVQTMNRPPNVDLDVWEKAIKYNPDPKHLYPTQLVGFQELKGRVSDQDKNIQMHLERLREIQNHIKNASDKRAIEFAVKLEEYKKKYKILAQRVLKLSAKIEILRYHGFAIQPEEYEWKQNALQIESELKKPDEYCDKLNQLEQRFKLGHMNQKVVPKKVTLHEEDISKVENFLTKQSEGLETLTQILLDLSETLREVDA